jgi:poly-gamma-glutamate system protein
MKKIYWRPRAVSRPALVLITLISIFGLMIVEAWKVETPQPYQPEKLAAAKLALRAMDVVKREREDSGAPIDPAVDPAETGLIGLPMSVVTSVSGEVSAKQTSANPNFAAVIVEMLEDAGVQEGDVVAIGVSGSFPALNICAYAACEALKLKPVVIASASASQWGANVPQLMWVDMERILAEKKVFSTRSVAASIGGYEDRGLGLSDDGRKLVETAIQRCGLEFLNVEDFTENINKRMEVYYKAAEGLPIKAYVNVGGGTVSVGRSIGKKTFHPGLNKRPPRHVRDVDGVMARFILAGVPVIHLVQINALATRYGLPVSTTSLIHPELAPAKPQMPDVGQGGVYRGINYSKPLVIGVLGFILMSLYGFIRSDVGFRLLKASQSSKKRDTQPEPMI